MQVTAEFKGTVNCIALADLELFAAARPRAQFKSLFLPTIPGASERARAM